MYLFFIFIFLLVFIEWNRVAQTDTVSELREYILKWSESKKDAGI